MAEKLLAQRVADDIMNMITNGKFAAGDKLPNENELAKLLCVSRNTLREAIRILNAYGFLTIQRGVGTFITETVKEGSLETNLNPLEYAKISLKDLFEMRLILEPEAAYFAVLRGTDGEIKQILNWGNVVAKQIRMHEDRTNEEHAFHAAIANATHNKALIKILAPIHEAILKGVRLSKVYERVEQETIFDHAVLIDFIEKRDADGARDAMRIHIRRAIHSLQLI